MTELQACLRPDVTLQGCYAISYSLLSAAELRDGIGNVYTSSTKKNTFKSIQISLGINKY